jgi:tripartite-type tricarboxylate transporter receptor subunit TctC
MKTLFLSLFLAVLSLSVQAKETVTIVYSWTPADPAANFHRTLADEANKIQNKYTFVFDAKPGAGGSIAANYVANTPNTILANASAFYIRPNFFPKESHDINSFKLLMPQCSGPIAISSKKYKSWSEVPIEKPLTIGVSGFGTTTHLVANQISKRYPNLQVVPFKSTSEAVLSVLSGNTDFAVGFTGDTAQYVNADKNRVYVLGVTGDHPINGAPTLASQGFAQTITLMNSVAQLLVPVNISEERYKEYREILVKAGRGKTVTDAFAVDFCRPMNQMPNNEIPVFFDTQTKQWKKLTVGVSLK